MKLIQRVLLDALPQEEVMSLPDGHVTLTNLFSLVSYRGATVIKFGQ